MSLDSNQKQKAYIRCSHCRRRETFPNIYCRQLYIVIIFFFFSFSLLFYHISRTGQFQKGCRLLCDCAHEMQNIRHLINRRFQLQLNFCLLIFFSSLFFFVPAVYMETELDALHAKILVNNSWMINGMFVQLTGTLIAILVVLTAANIHKESRGFASNAVHTSLFKVIFLYLCSFYISTNCWHLSH